MLTRVGVASARFFITHLRFIRHAAVEKLIQKTYNHLKCPRACGVTAKVCRRASYQQPDQHIR